MSLKYVNETLRNENTFSELSSQGNSFQKAFSHALARSTSSRRPRMEFSGILIPAAEATKCPRFSYTLKNKVNSHPLLVSPALVGCARELEGKEVIVRGRFDFDSFSIEAEELKPTRPRTEVQHVSK